MLAEMKLFHPELVICLLQKQACFIGGILLCALIGLFIAWRPIQIVKLKEDIQYLHQLKAEMIEINSRFNIEKASLSRLERIEKKAKQEFGFIDPQENQIIDFSKISSFHTLQ